MSALLYALHSMKIILIITIETAAVVAAASNANYSTIEFRSIKIWSSEKECAIDMEGNMKFWHVTSRGEK